MTARSAQVEVDDGIVESVVWSSTVGDVHEGMRPAVGKFVKDDVWSEVGRLTNDDFLFDGAGSLVLITLEDGTWEAI